MVIIAERIGRNPHPALSRRERGIVWNCQYKDGFALGQDLFQVCATGSAAVLGQIVHCAVHVLVEPIFKDIVMCGRLGRSNASQDESQLARFVFDGLFKIVVQNFIGQ